MLFLNAQKADLNSSHTPWNCPHHRHLPIWDPSCPRGARPVCPPSIILYPIRVLPYRSINKNKQKYKLVPLLVGRLRNSLTWILAISNYHDQILKSSCLKKI